MANWYLAILWILRILLDTLDTTATMATTGHFGYFGYYGYYWILWLLWILRLPLDTLEYLFSSLKWWFFIFVFIFFTLFCLWELSTFCNALNFVICGELEDLTIFRNPAYYIINSCLIIYHFEINVIFCTNELDFDFCLLSHISVLIVKAMVTNNNMVENRTQLYISQLQFY